MKKVVAILAIFCSSALAQNSINGVPNQLVSGLSSSGNIIYLAPPVQPPGTITATPSTSGGTLAANTYYIVATATNGTGETIGSSEASATTTGTTSSIATSWTAVTGATGYKVYVGTTSGSEGQYFTTATNSYTVTTATGTAGTVPTINTTADMGSEFNTAETMLLSDIPAGGVIVFPAGSSNIATPAVKTSNAISIYGYGVQATLVTCTVQGDCIRDNPTHTAYEQSSGPIAGFTMVGDPALTQLSAPGTVTATPSTTGGTLATGTYYYKVTASTSSGETTASPEASAAVTGPTGSVALSWGAVTGATGYVVYRGTSAGGEHVYYTTATNSYTDTNATSSSGSPYTVNTTNQVLLHHIDVEGEVDHDLFFTGMNNSYGVCDEYEDRNYWTEQNLTYKVQIHRNSVGNGCLYDAYLYFNSPDTYNSFGYNHFSFATDPTSGQYGVYLNGAGMLYGGVLDIQSNAEGGTVLGAANGFYTNSGNSNNVLNINAESNAGCTLFSWNGGFASFYGVLQQNGCSQGTAFGTNSFYYGYQQNYQNTIFNNLGGTTTAAVTANNNDPSGLPQAFNGQCSNNQYCSSFLGHDTGNGDQWLWATSYSGANNAANHIELNYQGASTWQFGAWVNGDVSIGSTADPGSQLGVGSSNQLKIDASGNLSTSGTVTATHLYASGVPTIAAGTGAGTSPTISITGNDEAGYISLTTGTAPTASATIFTVTLHNACTTGAIAEIKSANAAAAGLSGTTHEYMSNPPAAGTWGAVSNTTGLTASTAYVWNYLVRCY